MTFHLQRILESKRAYRQKLATKSIAEKLRMLDAMRARALTITPKPSAPHGVMREAATEYRSKDNR